MTDIAADITLDLIHRLNISPSMHILDVGCGRGDVTFLLAELIGGEGRIVGVDRDENALALAREEAKVRGLTNVSFAHGDLIPDDVPQEGFDAAISRRVFMYQRDAINAVSRVASTIKSGGIIALQEHDSHNDPNLEKFMPVHSKIHSWIWEMVEREGGQKNIGENLFSILASAGLKDIDIRAEATVLTPEYDASIPSILKAVWLRILNQGIIEEAKYDIDVLQKKLFAERVNNKKTAVWDMAFLSTARNP